MMDRNTKGMWISGAGLLVLIGLIAGCEIDSAETAYRNVDIAVEGFYSNGSTPLVSRNTGSPIRSMNVRQTGDRLEGVDNNGIVFRGSIGQVTGGEVASFTLNGRTTAGADGTISGNFTVSGSRGVMQGTWIEPTAFGDVYGTATVPTNAPDVTPTPTNDTSTVTP